MERSVSAYKTNSSLMKLSSSIKGFTAEVESDIFDLIVETINELMNITSMLLKTVWGLFK